MPSKEMKGKLVMWHPKNQINSGKNTDLKSRYMGKKHTVSNIETNLNGDGITGTPRIEKFNKFLAIRL
jgi:hypothetical protein